MADYKEVPKKTPPGGKALADLDDFRKSVEDMDDEPLMAAHHENTTKAKKAQEDKNAGESQIWEMRRMMTETEIIRRFPSEMMRKYRDWLSENDGNK